MKRSEAIETIVSIISELDTKFGGSINECAEDILNNLEVKGLTPPINMIKSFKLMNSGEMSYNVHEWEEE